MSNQDQWAGMAFSFLEYLSRQPAPAYSAVVQADWAAEYFTQSTQRVGKMVVRYEPPDEKERDFLAGDAAAFCYSCGWIESRTDTRGVRCLFVTPEGLGVLHGFPVAAPQGQPATSQTKGSTAAEKALRAQQARDAVPATTKQLCFMAQARGLWPEDTKSLPAFGQLLRRAGVKPLPGKRGGSGNKSMFPPETALAKLACYCEEHPQ